MGAGRVDQRYGVALTSYITDMSERRKGREAKTGMVAVVGKKRQTRREPTNPVRAVEGCPLFSPATLGRAHKLSLSDVTRPAVITRPDLLRSPMRSRRPVRTATWPIVERRSDYRPPSPTRRTPAGPVVAAALLHRATARTKHRSPSQRPRRSGRMNRIAHTSLPRFALAIFGDSIEFFGVS